MLGAYPTIGTLFKVVGSFVHHHDSGILMWPVAICDLGTFLNDYDTLFSFVTFTELRHIHQAQMEMVLDQNARKRFEALHAVKPAIGSYRACRASRGTKNMRGCTGAYDVRWGLNRLKRLFGCLSTALAYLHEQNVKHKDLKPSNILLTKENIYVTDFGTSTDISEVTTTATDNGNRGTPKYFAPEVANYEPSGRAADVFSLGCIFLEVAYVIEGVRLERLRELRPNRDRSFHANLDEVQLWIRELSSSWPPRPRDLQFLDLVQDMLQREAKQRPKGDELVARLHAIWLERSDSPSHNDLVAFDPCCRPSTPSTDPPPPSLRTPSTRKLAL